MESIGADLKAAREKKGVTLRQIAEATRISLQHLENLEAGKYSIMPGGMYNRAFIRSYAEFVGLDPSPFLDHYEQEILPPSEKPVKSRPPELIRLGRERRIHPVAVWAILLAISTAGLYWSRDWISQIFSPYFSQSPAGRVEPAFPPSQPQVAPPNAQASPQALAALAPGGSEVTAQLPLPRPPQPPGTIRIEFEVVEKCWVSVNSDGNQVLVKLLEKGDDEYFDARERFFLLLGNAGGVRLKINGKRAKPLGKSGEVLRLLINAQNIPDLLENS